MLIIFKPLSKLCRHWIGWCIIFLFLLCHIPAYIGFACTLSGFTLLKCGEFFTIAADTVEGLLVTFATKLHLFMAVGASGIGGLAETLALTALSVLTDKHFTTFALNFKQKFSAVGAFFLSLVVVDIFRFTGFYLSYQL